MAPATPVELPVVCVSVRPMSLTGPEAPVKATGEQQKRWDEHVQQDAAAAAGDAAAGAAATAVAAPAVVAIREEEEQGVGGSATESASESASVTMKASALFYDPFAAKRARARLDASAKPMVLTKANHPITNLTCP